LTLIASKDYGTYVGTLAWHPSGTVLAIGGTGPAAVGDFANTHEVRLYRFDGSTLTGFTSVDYGTNARIMHWNPSGTVLAVGGEGPANELQLYSFNGATLSSLTSANWGDHIHGMKWSPDGRHLALTGDTPDSTNELQVYSFNGSTLTLVASYDYGAAGADLRSISWHPSGMALAIGGDGPTSGNELQVFKFNGSTLTLVDSKDYGSQISEVAWNPEGTVLAIGGYTPTNPSGGFADNNELRLYSASFAKSSSPQSFSKSIVFGNSTLGSNYNLNVEVLGGAHVTVDGKIVDDSV
jgi:dipeptidyl aminopeptidase/acylaminoacyl peptidase